MTITDVAKRFRLHLVGLPHTELADPWSWCAFSSLAKTFATMMHRRGHEVICYAGAKTTAECTENVVCHDEVSDQFFVPPWEQEYFRSMNERVIVEMRQRIRPGDLILLSMGVVQIDIQNAFPDNVSIEYCVGYGGSTSPARVFPSEAWRHTIYGHNAPNVMVITGMCSDAVIPHFLDPAAFPVGLGGDYLLFAGRLGGMKGENIAIETSRRTGIPLKIIGPGPVPDYGEYLGVVGPKERAELMGGALAVMAPSLFPEPFCLVAIEAQMVGTPVITTDWGAVTETVEQGVSGYRCTTMTEFDQAARDVKSLDRDYVRTRALGRYSTDAIAPQYEKFFERMKEVYPGKFAAGSVPVRPVAAPGEFAVLIPSRNRPHLMEKLVANIREVTPEPFGLYFAVTDKASLSILHSLGVEAWLTDPDWSAVERSQFLYENTDEPYFYIGQDDSLFHPGWLAGLDSAREVDGLVAVNDLYNPSGTTCFTSRRYVNEESCAPDAPNVIAHFGYHHDWAETEAFEVAKSRGRFAYCTDSVVQHLHHSTGKTPYDDTYAESERWAQDDAALFLARRHLWAVPAAA